MAERCSVKIFLYRAVLFDMDGVIADTMPLHYEAWRRAFEAFGVHVDKMDVYLREGMTTMEMGKDIARSKGMELSEGELNSIVELKTRIFNELVDSSVRLYEGVPETLTMLRNNGMKLALVTGSRRTSAMAVLKKVGLEGAFDAIVAAEDVRRGKPDAEPYLVAMRAVDVPALNCVVVENAPLGIRAARAAKVGYIIAIATTLDEAHLKEADEVAPSFPELEQCIARRFEARPGRAIM
ncbi:haloacid dehalogenase superfamily, subfamily IA, variant 3 with third motif having DD or ED [Methanocella conradii HZ254]|uniref:Haloacid dehalogenase superfamily, subfamily IA, variant 3 with third motif having DD or ED n=1 Tax=Methanocella conradii (strain DSM 24694 / JCM 17849 / CGMCC 1.5162 / HZ254) TaxID=1041930 RepID=H8IAB6_METCZ|nr:HAD family phosphatase [Methanocella conradii]AFC99590.1 haloacid dehalogenase superfamily, subfamily IA, variant 3 with third motif having DD or ED [Methanocella conradii HZ254]MDI6897437.1 HAD family phosphatase [Methanocella conradii]